jgi:hypothetical protein
LSLIRAGATLEGLLDLVRIEAVIRAIHGIVGVPGARIARPIRLVAEFVVTSLRQPRSATARPMHSSMPGMDLTTQRTLI